MTELLMLKSKYLVSELLWLLFLDFFVFIFSTLSLGIFESLIFFFWDKVEDLFKEESFGLDSM